MQSLLARTTRPRAGWNRRFVLNIHFCLSCAPRCRLSQTAPAACSVRDKCCSCPPARAHPRPQLSRHAWAPRCGGGVRTSACIPRNLHPPPSSYQVDTQRPSPRTDRTRFVPHPVLIGWQAAAPGLADAPHHRRSQKSERGYNSEEASVHEEDEVWRCNFCAMVSCASYLTPKSLIEKILT